ncbi:MAG: methyl-accepting chemotaxis protein [Treponema sp.]|nr:methyl-accepting chemotaxis protein [Treponema sp.]
MKIGVKLVVVISMVNLIGIGLLAGVTLIQSQEEISRLVDEEAQSIALQNSERISKWFEGNISATRIMAQIMEGYKEIPVEARRDYFNMMLREVLTSNPSLLGMYANWAPGALDGLDVDYANTPGNDDTGRFIPSWTMSNGQLQVTPIASFSWDLVMQLPQTKQEYMLDPTEYPYLLPEGRVLYANMGNPVRDKETGAFVGMAGATIVLSTIQKMVEEIKPFGNGYAFVFSSGGVVAAHRDPTRLGKNMRESETDTFGPFLDTMVEAVTKGTAASFSYQPLQSETAIQYYAVPFKLGNVPLPWTLVVAVSHSTIMAPVYRMLRICLIIGFLSISVMFIGVLFIARSISRPINRLALMFKDISQGAGDLTKTISITAHDEIGDLAHYFNLTIDTIKELVVAIKREALALSHTGSDMAENMNETASSINEITATIQSIKAQTGKQQTSVKGTRATMEQVVENIEALNSRIQKQSECVSQSSAAVEQMLANINNVTQTLVKNEANVTKLAHASEVGQTSLQRVSSDIQDIAKESAGLLEINAVMENIASQTNLLGMNAAIEAAHAGEAGRGFAVVASEIRKLAESSSAQSKTISDVLKKIKGSVDKIIPSTAEVLRNFEAINQGVKTVTDQETNVRTAMKEQETGSKAILESIGSLNEITGEVKGSATGMLGGSREVIQESRTLESFTSEIGNGIQEMASGAEQIDTAVNRVNDISVENKKQIEQLITEVSRFKVA